MEAMVAARCSRSAVEWLCVMSYDKVHITKKNEHSSDKNIKSYQE